MAKYSSFLAARRLVSKRTKLGEPRHHSETNSDLVKSYGTARSHRCALKVAADWLYEEKSKKLENMNELDAAEYLTLRAMTVNQKTLDLDRQAINFHLFFEDPIPFVASEIQQVLTNRAYCASQIDLMVAEANPKLELSIRIAEHAGLRAQELITIALPEQLQESQRKKWDPRRFAGREDEVPFVVHGKGGLHRQVRLPTELAQRLLGRMRAQFVYVVDREINHKSFFDLVGGTNFSKQFSNLSRKVLGMTNGAHGLRHSYAQRRLRDLMCRGFSFDDAVLIVSNELGHFCTSNTFAYLRD
jgi:integrase